MRSSGIGGSLFLIAIGAILYWAVSADVEGFDLDLIGLILMIVGAIGIVLTFILTAADAERNDSDVTVVDR